MSDKKLTPLEERLAKMEQLSIANDEREREFHKASGMDYMKEFDEDDATTKKPMTEVHVDGEDDVDASAAERAAADAQSDEEAQAAARAESEAAKQAKTESTKAKVTAKVNGEEEEVEVEYLTSQYQKLRHAEREMEKAAIARKELELRSRELDLQRQQLLDIHNAKMKELEQGQAVAAAKQAASIPSHEDLMKIATSSLFSGDEDKAAKSLNDAISARVNAELERRLAQEATKIKDEATDAAGKMLAQARLVDSWQSAIDQATSKNPEFLKDEDLAVLFDQKLRQASSKGMQPKEAVEFASKSLERFVAPKKQDDVKQGFKVNADDLKEKEARKQESKKFAVDSKAVAVSGNKSGDEVELTNAELIEQIRQARKPMSRR